MAISSGHLSAQRAEAQQEAEVVVDNDSDGSFTYTPSTGFTGVGVCADAEAPLLANNTITDAFSSASESFVAPVTCTTVNKIHADNTTMIKQFLFKRFISELDV